MDFTVIDEAEEILVVTIRLFENLHSWQWSCGLVYILRSGCKIFFIQLWLRDEQAYTFVISRIKSMLPFLKTIMFWVLKYKSITSVAKYVTLSSCELSESQRPLEQ